jgi:DNA-binding transcriptional ArsR family regulator
MENEQVRKEHVPPSVEAILQQLEGHAPMTGKELREATGLPRRTIYTALRRLREMGLLEERSSLRDTRQTYFWISGTTPVKKQ